MKPRTTAMVSALLIALFFLTPGSAWAEPAKPEGTFITAMEFDAGSLDPNLATAWASKGITYNIFQALTGQSRLSYETIGNVAKSWDMENQTTWKFKLRQGVKFQNGQPLTSKDVAFSFNRLMGRIDRRYAGFAKKMYSRLIDRIETPDDYTVVFYTKYPEPVFTYMLGGILIVPQAYVEEIGDKEFAKKPIGCGPYRFKDRKRGESITLGANETFWNTDSNPEQIGPSRVEAVVFRIIPQMQTRIAALKANEIHACVGITVDQSRALEKESDIRLYYNDVNRPQSIKFNWLDEKDPSTGEPNPLRDVRVRRALNYALDLDTIIKSYLTGKEHRTTLIGRGSFGYNPDVPFYTYNPEKAKALLKEAGYENGFSMPFFSSTDIRPEMQAIFQYWRDVGINVQIKQTTQALVIGQVLQKKLYGFVRWNHGRGAETAKGFFDTMLLYEGQYAQHPKDERIETLVQQWLQEFDLEKRARLTHEIITILWEDAWYVPLWEPVVIAALRNEWDYEHTDAMGSFVLPYISRKK